MSKIKMTILALLGLLLLACTQTNGQTADLATPTPIPTPIVPEKPIYTAQLGAVVNTIEFTARVSPLQEQSLFFRSGGFIDQVFVQRGQQVQAGAVLAQLEISDLQNQLAQAQVNLETAEIRLAQADQNRQDELAEALLSRERIEIQLAQAQAGGQSANIVSARIELENAQQRLADASYELQKSLDREWEPEALRRQYEQGVENAQNSLTIAQARYNDALAGGNANSYQRQLLEQDLALIDLRIAKLEREIDPLLALDVERARLAVQQIERQIADAQLIAPFAGEIFSVGATPGSRIEAFAPVMVLAQPDELELTADLGAEQLAEMSVGQGATITLRNRPAEALSGTVRLLPLAFSGGSASVRDSDNRTRITLDGAISGLAVGELATVVIVLEERPDVVWLPPAAIRTFQGRTFVVIQDGDGQRRVDVRLGIQSAERVEILEGVSAGQVIVGE